MKQKIVLFGVLVLTLLLLITACEEVVSPQEEGGPFRVTYHENGASGSPPIDGSLYAEGATVTVLGNVGSPPLSRTGYAFDGWNTRQDGLGTARDPGSTFPMPASDVALHAMWRDDSSGGDTGEIDIVVDDGGSGEETGEIVVVIDDADEAGEIDVVVSDNVTSGSIGVEVE